MGAKVIRDKTPAATAPTFRRCFFTYNSAEWEEAYLYEAD